MSEPAGEFGAEGPRFDAGFQADFAKLLAWRRDVRRFGPGAVPEPLLAELIDLTAFAPSVGNCQPTRFVRVDDPARRRAIQDNFETANRAALSSYEGERARAYARLKLAGLREAPVQLAVFCDERNRTRPWPRRQDDAGNAALFLGLRVAHVLARGAGAGTGRRLGVHPGSRTGRADSRRALHLDARGVLVRRLAREAQRIPELERAGWQNRVAPTVLRR